MYKIACRRQEIYDYFQNNESCKQFFIDTAQKERYAAYYTSMYLLQDTTESLVTHREKGFSSDPFMAYIEFWGVMQALIIQQDSITELYKTITDTTLDTSVLNSWQELRKLRNTCAGHPAKKDRPKNSPLTRTFMSRDFGDYSMITYKKWQAPDDISHPTVSFGVLIDRYAKEAESKLAEVLQSMKQQ